MKFKKALITGIMVKMSYLAAFLLKKKYKFTELKENHHHLTLQELIISMTIKSIKISFFLHYGDL